MRNTGLPYAIIVTEAQLDGETLLLGDEVAVFDGDLCVGATVVESSFPDTAMVITAWQGDPSLELEGFTPGQPIVFKVWLSTQLTEADAIPEFIEGNGNFGAGPYSSATLEVLAP